MYPRPVDPEEAKWQRRDDARTLARAEEIVHPCHAVLDLPHDVGERGVIVRVQGILLNVCHGGAASTCQREPSVTVRRHFHLISGQHDGIVVPYIHIGNGSRVISLSSLGGGDTTGIIDAALNGESDSEIVKVHTLSGVFLKQGPRGEVLRSLPKGVYIINGKKVIK